MSLTFPDTPSLNERFIYNDKVYTWNGTKWVTGPIGNKLISGEYRNVLSENSETFIELDTVRYNFFDITTNNTNLLIDTQDFSKASWAKTNGTITSNSITNPINGELTADSFIETNANTQQKIVTQNFTFVSGTRYTLSVYAKAIGNRHILLVLPDAAYGSFYEAYFNLSAGSFTINASATSGGAVATITQLTNGWYRCTFSATATISASSYVQYRLLDSPTTINLYTGDGVSGMYLWGAQCEIGSFASPYNNTSANLLTDSQVFSSSSWTKFGGTITDNVTYDPIYGQKTADAFIEINGNTTEKYMFQYKSFIAGTTYTLSIYAKPITGNRNIVLILPSIAYGSNFIASFDLTNGVYNLNSSAISGGATATIAPVIDGWYRCTITATATATADGLTQFRMMNIYPGASPNYTGDGVSGLYLWGAQFEVGSSATKYKRVVSQPHYNLILKNSSVYDKILVKLNVGGQNTIEWNTIPYNIIWSEGAAPTITQNKIIMIEFQKFKDQWYGYVLTKNVSI